MSSAALQSAPHQPTALASPPMPSSSNRQYGSPHSSPSRAAACDAHLAATSSPSSRRPPSRKASGNGGSSSVDQTVPRSSRNGTSASSPQEYRPSRSERSANMPPVAPPRTSSSGQQGASSRRPQYPNDPVSSSPRHNPPDSQRSGSHGDTNGYSETSRSKRAANSHQPQDQTRPSSNRDNKTAEMTIPIRTNPASSSKHPHDLGDDLARAIPNAEEPNGSVGHHTSSQDRHDAAQPPVVPMNPPGEERRGGRSRHDHSRSHKGTTKFGDFILGNTIGEGEFGKVKLGWKQDSSVQVCVALKQ